MLPHLYFPGKQILKLAWYKREKEFSELQLTDDIQLETAFTVERQKWLKAYAQVITKDEVIKVVREINDRKVRVEIIADKITKGDNSNKLLVQEAIEAITSIRDDWNRAKAYRLLFFKLTPQEIMPQLTKALSTILRIEGEERQTKMLIDIAESIEDRSIRKTIIKITLDSMVKIDDEAVRVQTKEYVKNRLAAMGEVEIGLKIARTIEDAEDISITLRAFSIRLMSLGNPIESLRLLGWKADTKSIDEWIVAALEYNLLRTEPEGNTPHIEQLYPHEYSSTADVQSKIMLDVIFRLLAIQIDSRSLKGFLIDNNDQSEIANLIQHNLYVYGINDDNIADLAIRIAENIENNRWKAIALTILSKELSEEYRNYALESAKHSARNIINEWDRAKILLELSLLQNSDELIMEVFATIRTLKKSDEFAYTQAITELAPTMAKLGYRDEALQFANSLNYHHHSHPRELAYSLGLFPIATTLSDNDDYYSLAKRLSIDFLGSEHCAEQILKIILNPKKAKFILEKFDVESRGKLSELVLKVEATWRWWTLSRIEALRAILPFLSLDQASSVLLELLEMFETFIGYSHLAEFFEEIGPYIDNHNIKVIQRLLKVLYDCEDKETKFKASITIAPHLIPVVRSELIHQESISFHEWKSKLETTRKYDKETLIQMELKLLLLGISSLDEAVVDDDQLNRCIELIQKLTLVDNKANAIIGLAPYLTQEFSCVIIQLVAEDIDDREQRYHIFQVVAQKATNSSNLAQGFCFAPNRKNTLLRTLAKRSRKHLLSDIRALDTLITDVGGSQAMSEAAIAIKETAKWWP